jgi:hypothetical protein
MTCEHGVQIYADCELCTVKYNSEGQTWETKQIRRELAQVDSRVVMLQKEREWERQGRRKAEMRIAEAIILLRKAAHYVGDSFKEEIETWTQRA